MDKKVCIYAMTHKRFDESHIDLYKPLFVGAHGKEDTYGYIRDDSGDNISHKNCYYSELTGLYWVYKNVTDMDIVGCCHYRRYLIDDDENILSKEQIIGYLKDYDCITSKCLDLNYTYYYGFSENHKPYYLDETRKVIQDIYPDYLADYDRLVNDKHTYFGNILICEKPLFDEYAKWLFDILFTLEDRIVIEEENSYHRRIFGFISEFLWFLWVKHNKLAAKELKVGIVGEKIEIKAVRARLREYFAAGDVDGAKKYFLEAKKARPDMMMEASDITGELHICMQAIAIAGLEREMGLDDIISTIRDYDKIIDYLVRLNNKVIEGQEADIKDDYSFVALEVARRMYIQ